MYESLLNRIYSDIQSQMIKQDEENMMLCINKAVGYSVDKQELIKALNYDREQYEKGYKDAMSVIEDIKAEIEHIIPCDKEALSVKLGVLEIIDEHMRGET